MEVISGDALAISPASIAGNELVRGYQPELDAVRFFAFFLVFVHSLLLTSDYVTTDHLFAFTGQTAWRNRFALGQAGAMGLCLFFALSAYLITNLLLSERRTNAAISVRKFYIRRALRIWPLYFFGVSIGFAIALLLHMKSDVTAFAWFLLFAGNFYCGAFGWLHNPMNPLWSISVEEQFYLLWPWALRYLSKRGLYVCALVFILMANIALLILRRNAHAEIPVWTSTFVQFEMFSVGILLALARKHITWANPGIGLALAFTGPVLWILACLELNSKEPAAGIEAISGLALILSYGVVALGCAAVLQGFLMIGPSHIPRWAAGLGKISFGLYVYHDLAIDFAEPLCRSAHGLISFMSTLLVSFVLTVAIAVISYAFLETPFLRLKRRFEILHSRPI